MIFLLFEKMKFNILQILFPFLLFLSNSSFSSFVPEVPAKCERIAIPLCHQIGYNYTSYPNALKQTNQIEASLTLQDFRHLFESKCSHSLPLLLCSVFTPICLVSTDQTSGGVPVYNLPRIPVCRAICERAQRGCEPVMNQFGFEWPSFLNCSAFPVNGVCMDDKAFRDQPDPEDNPNIHGNGVLDFINNYNPNLIVENKPEVDHSTQAIDISQNYLSPPKRKSSENCHDFCTCRAPYFTEITENDSNFRNSLFETAVGMTPNCVTSCIEKFPGNLVTSFQYSIIILSVICLVLAILTFLTFLINPSKFSYSERALICMVTCYLFSTSGGYLLSTLVSENFPCVGDFMRYPKLSGKVPSLCVVNFVAHYYFGLASGYWWLIWTVTWFLSTRLQWAQEAISTYSLYFHLLAWILPYVQTGFILYRGSIDGDPLLHACSVGNQNRYNLLTYRIIPSVICLSIGSLLSISSLFSLHKIYRSIGQINDSKENQTKSLKKLLIKQGILSTFFILSKAAILACLIYEYIQRPKWEKDWNCPCDSQKSSTNDVISLSTHFPLLIKHHLELVIGIVPAFQLCFHSKTIDSWIWRRIFNKMQKCEFDNTYQQINENNQHNKTVTSSSNVSSSCHYVSLMALPNNYLDMEELELPKY